ncbi:hypothetical protein, partial [Enterobacter hormaechei]|uniref:hypothetical protein n=1 Tax=Enterobacter hormaechei TaxID=158836 RepID=UPI0013D130D6
PGLTDVVGGIAFRGLLEAPDECSFGQMGTLGKPGHGVAQPRFCKDQMLGRQDGGIIVIEPGLESLQGTLVLPDAVTEHEAGRGQHDT